MRYAGALVLLAATGCGRMGFDASGDRSDANVNTLACTDPSVMFCEDFEGPLTPRWTSFGNGAVTTTTTIQHAGTTALHARTTAPNGQAMLQTDLPALTSGQLHYRGWYRFPTGPTLTLLEVVAMHAPGGDNGESIALRQNAVEGYAGPAMVAVPTTVPTVPRDAWVCLELAVTIGDTSGALTVYANGQPVGARTNIDTLPAGGLSQLLLGIVYSADNQQPYSVYVDDVAVASQRIGCT